MSNRSSPNAMQRHARALLTALLALCACTLHAQTPTLWSTPTFSIALDPHGLITSITSPADPLRMSWVRETGPAWGLPVTREAGKLVTWDPPTIASSTPLAEELHFTHGPFTVVLDQSLSPDSKLQQSYTLRNTSARPITLAEGDFGIRIPLPDNYPDAATALTRRTDVHVWTGGTTAWIEAFRMNGHAPHLSLVLTAGALTAYSITDRPQNSNDRGTFVLHPPALTLAPGASTTLAWSLFWNTGWDDFFAQASHVPGFIRLQAESYTTFPGHPLHIAADAETSLARATITVNGKPAHPTLRGNHLDLSYMPTTPGDQLVELTLGPRHTTLRAFSASAPLDLIQARVRFLIEHQQRNAPGDPTDGAFLIFDNETGQQVLEKSNDHNAGRERVGMGVLLALYLPLCKDPQLKAAIQTSLDRYWKFVDQHLQDPTGKVFNDTDNPKQRLYNYPWVARLHLSMYANTRDPRYLDAFVRTIRAFYRAGGERFYPIGLPITDGLAALSQAGRTDDHAALLALFHAHADRIVSTGMAMPKSEVNYEQSIVGPAAGILLETFLATHDPKYRTAATPFLDALFAFNGQQPDHHLNDIAIRHWDDFWFGKAHLYGDTFPQYWSTITALVLDDLAQANLAQPDLAQADLPQADLAQADLPQADSAQANAALTNSAEKDSVQTNSARLIPTSTKSAAANPALTKAADLRSRATKIIANNLSAFTPEGRASCAFVYPLTVNDHPGRLQDPWANDQDWTLVHYLLHTYPKGWQTQEASK